MKSLEKEENSATNSEAEIIKEDSEKKPDLDSTKEVQKNGDGGSKDDDEIMIIGIITQRKLVMFNVHLKEYMF